MKDLRKNIRPALYVNNIHQVEDRDLAYDYKNVIFTYDHDPSRVDRYEQSGWEVVMTTKSLLDDRSFSPKEKKEKIRPQECVSKTKDGHQQVLMRVLKTRRAENDLDKKLTREQLMLKESERRGDTVTKKGNNVITRGVELSE